MTTSAHSRSLQDLISTHTMSAQTLLQNWAWLLGDETAYQIAFVTRMGDAFLIGTDTQVYFLDVVDGMLEPVCESLEALEKLLGDDEFVLDYFDSDVVLKVAVDPWPGDVVLAPDTPAVLGGEATLESLQLVDMQQYFDRMGDLWASLSQLDIESEEQAGGSA